MKKWKWTFTIRRHNGCAEKLNQAFPVLTKRQERCVLVSKAGMKLGRKNGSEQLQDVPCYETLHLPPWYESIAHAFNYKNMFLDWVNTTNFSSSRLSTFTCTITVSKISLSPQISVQKLVSFCKSSSSALSLSSTPSISFLCPIHHSHS